MTGSRDLSRSELQERHDREVRESQREERRLLIWEGVVLLGVVAFLVVRQLWLV